MSRDTIILIQENATLIEKNLAQWIEREKRVDTLPEQILQDLTNVRKELLEKKRKLEPNSSRLHAISRLVRSGATFADFVLVHRSKTIEWKGNRMEDKITPECLHRDSNFWRYLEAAEKPTTLSGKVEKANRTREIVNELV